MFCFQNLHTYCFKHEIYASFKILEIALFLRGEIFKKPAKLANLKPFLFISSFARIESI